MLADGINAAIFARQLQHLSVEKGGLRSEAGALRMLVVRIPGEGFLEGRQEISERVGDNGDVVPRDHQSAEAAVGDWEKNHFLYLEIVQMNVLGRTPFVDELGPLRIGRFCAVDNSTIMSCGSTRNDV